MAASVYATPPPDLSGEEAALSDASNSSQTNSSHSSTLKASKRTLSSSFLNTVTTQSSTLTTTSQLSSDSLPDLSKKRRKQSMPIRFSTNGTAIEVPPTAGSESMVDVDERSSEEAHGDVTEPRPESDPEQAEANNSSNPTSPAMDTGEDAGAALLEEQQNNFHKIFLSNLSQLQQKHLQLQQQHQQNAEGFLGLGNAGATLPESFLTSKLNSFIAMSGARPERGSISLPRSDDENEPEGRSQATSAGPDQRAHGQSPVRENASAADIDQKTQYSDRDGDEQGRRSNDSPASGEEKPTEQSPVTQSPPKISLKKELMMDPEWDGEIRSNLPKSDDWISIAGLSFPFPPEAAAALSASGYLPQLPLLGVPSVSAFGTSGDGSSRPGVPPLRIFNPEAYCDLCNKEFCNKYFLKTHKANKHGIYEPAPSNEDATFTPQPRKLSPHSMQAAKEANFSADKLRRLGVINPEAFCEICCKEYCNKYFLRTHKLKRHGILPTPDELKDEGRQPWAPFLQTSPLNLIMGGTAADVVSAQMALQAASPSSLRKLMAASELGTGSVAIEGAKGVEIKRERSPPAKGTDNGGTDSDDQQQSDGGLTGANNGGDGARDGGSDEDAEAISVDLQKLQSMIMQLNDLNSIQQHRKVGCGVCGKELANQYLLHAHMIQEHGALAMDNNNGPKGSRAPTPGEVLETCKHCDKEFANVYMLKQHLVEVHGSLPGMPSPKREGFVTPERPTTGTSGGGTGTSGASVPIPPPAPGYGERKPSYSMTPTSSYCEICNKELCNKYFMKTHMQRMHGIEIENGAQIGGVVCNICNKELCSKYFLRVHKHNTHGIVEEGAPLPQARQNGSSTISGASEVSVSDAGDGVSFPGAQDLKPGEVSDLSNRYYSHFTEVCPLCSRRFRSAKWLRAHLLSDHGKLGVDKLKDIEQKHGSSGQNGGAMLGNGTNTGGGNGRSKSNSPSLKVPNGMNDSKYGSKSPFGGLSPAEAAKFLPKGATMPTLFGSEQPTSPMGGLKGYQCSYCSFATPLLPLLFIHERSHSSLTIVQQQLIQQQHQQEEAQAAAAAAAVALGAAPFAPLLKSESAVSLAKDQPPNQLIPGTSSETPSSTPASTPVPSLSQEALNLHQQARPQSPERAGSPRDPDPAAARSKPTSPKPASPSATSVGEPNAMLSEVANITQRPAVYALPQQSGPLMMQSFLIEESSLSGGFGTRSPKDSDKPEGPLGQDHRFVPAVVFLPVKERILTPMTISFNLSPA
uniref:C2H2-type domain-containing protein n=1 Tax=Anopheles farauti TaxID=69004 RepID=A0A182QSU1_9DIPT